LIAARITKYVRESIGERGVTWQHRNRQKRKGKEGIYVKKKRSNQSKNGSVEPFKLSLIAKNENEEEQ
jgi:hypothetical protein